MNVFDLPLTGTAPACHEICDRIRDAILNGTLTPGARIPPVQELVRLYDTSVWTIQAALDPLVKEGLLERRQKHGTFVRNRGESLGGVGVYFGVSDLPGNEMGFYHELQREILKELNARGASTKLWLDPRPAEEQGNPLPEIQRAILHREVQSLILGLSTEVAQKCLYGLNVPTSYFGAGNFPGKVYPRLSDIFRLGFQELKRQGCKSVGIITSLPISFLIKNAEEEPQFFGTFTETAKRFGLVLKSGWNRMPKTVLENHEFEMFGYQEFQSLWNQFEHPDGLIVFPDVMVRGVITAMLERGVSAPTDLKLVLHRHEGVPYLNPLPASYLVTSPRERAILLIDQLRRIIEGKQAPPILHSMVLETL